MAGVCDLVSLARPFLSDARLVEKARAGRSREINVCIACNQSCLDRDFCGRGRFMHGQSPGAVNETRLHYEKTSSSKRLAVIGAGPAGLSPGGGCHARTPRDHFRGGAGSWRAVHPGKGGARKGGVPEDQDIDYFPHHVREARGRRDAQCPAYRTGHGLGEIRPGLR